MIKYRITKADDKILNKMGEDNWQLISISENKFYFSKKITSKIDREKKDAIKTKEWIEFYEVYKTIKNSGLSNDNLILKYNKLVAEGLHTKILENLKDYKTYLEVKKKQDYALMASTYINQGRYNDEWEIVADMSRKFINDIYKEKELNSDEIDFINNEVTVWEQKQNREITDGVVRNIISVRLNK